MADPIEFPAVEDSSPRLTSIKGGRTLPGQYSVCQHHGGLVVDEDTQLVTCKACKQTMSSYSALMVLIKWWDRMRYDVTAWNKMKAEQVAGAKAEQVRRRIREFQWIELPGEDEPEARRMWQRLTEAMGREPYAMYVWGRGKQPKRFMVVAPPDKFMGCMSADSILQSAGWIKAQRKQEVSK